MAIHTLCNFSSFGMIDLFLHLGKCNPFVKHYVHTSNQVRVVAVSLPQLTQASFLQKNQTLQNRFLISVTLRWHRVSVARKNQSF